MAQCDRFHELLSRRLDEPLPPEQSAALDAHLSHCSDCRALSLDFAALAPLLARVGETPAPDGFAQEVLACLGQPAPGKKWVPSRRVWGSFAAAAAVFALLVGLSPRFLNLAMDGGMATGGAAPASAAPPAMESAAPQAAPAPAPAPFGVEVEDAAKAALDAEPAPPEAALAGEAQFKASAGRSAGNGAATDTLYDGASLVRAVSAALGQPLALLAAVEALPDGVIVAEAWQTTETGLSFAVVAREELEALLAELDTEQYALHEPGGDGPCVLLLTE